VEISVGSLSPTINWSTLKLEEFAIPPLNQQRRIAEILWAVNDALVRYADVGSQVRNTLEIWTGETLRALAQSGNGAMCELGELVDIRTGKLDSNCAVEGGKYPFFTCDTKTHQIDSYPFDCEALLLAGNNAVGVYPLKHFKESIPL